MSGHDAHETAQDGAHAEAPHAPGLPTVHDEAGDTPLWVPILGAVLLVLGGAWVVYELASYSSASASDVGDGGLDDGAAADGAADAGAPAAP